MSRHSDTRSLCRYVATTISELVPPLEEALWKEWEEGNDPPDGREDLVNSVWALGLQLAIADGDFSESEAAFIGDIRDALSLDTDENTGILSNAQIREIYLNSIKRASDLFSAVRAPFTLSSLILFDIDRGTDHASKAAAMYFRFANALLKADGRVTDKEAAILSRLKEDMRRENILSFSPERESIISAKEIEGPKAQAELPALEVLLDELKSMIGLEEVKTDILNLVNYLKVQKMREKNGMPSLPMSRHLVFYGNPGTGKTTVARLLAKIYHSLGISRDGHLVETDRSGLVAGFVGQTALKVKEVVSRSLGGVLFIDEAYSLIGEGQDYGREAVDTLIKLMEDNRDDLVVIVAGYTEKMGGFINSNPGLRSRFNKYFLFKDYTPEELLLIFESIAKSAGFTITSEARHRLGREFQLAHTLRDESFGNGRLARNVFEETVNRQANRIVLLPEVDKSVLSTIDATDIPRSADRDALARRSDPGSEGGNTATESRTHDAGRIRFFCPNCNKRLKVEAKYAGKRGKCVHCSHGVEVPQLGGTELHSE